MRAALIWIPLLIAANTVSLLNADLDDPANVCNGTTDTSGTSKRDEGVAEPSLETLMRCPLGMRSCSQELVSCEPNTYAVTCSCASNCRTYRDCCWSVPFVDQLDHELPEVSCVGVRYREWSIKTVHMVTGCPASWPQDEVRVGCEEALLFNDTFYFIPVTSENNVTYRNGYCAFCNQDITNPIFWNVTSPDYDRKSTNAYIPEFFDEHPTTYLRPCHNEALKDTCKTWVSEISRRCKTYYAPVTNGQDRGSSVYRNVYCALCDGANVSQHKCSPLFHSRNFTTAVPFNGHADRQNVPINLADLFKPVITTRTCYAEHNGHCYLRIMPSYVSESETAHIKLGSTRNRSHGKLRFNPTTYYGNRHYITLACMSLSIACLALKVIVYYVYNEAQNFSSKCTLCLSLTLLLAQLLFVITSHMRLQPIPCLGSSVLIHYGFLSTSFWTTSVSFDIWKSITAVQLSSSRARAFTVYAIVGWGGPLVVIAAALTVDFAAPTSILSPRYTGPNCWIRNPWGLVLYFLVPKAIVLLLCSTMWLRTLFYVRSTSSALRSFQDASSKCVVDVARRKQLWTHMALFARLAFIMGAPWIVIFLEPFVPIPEVDVLVNALVGLQGTYLFLAFKDYRYIYSSVLKVGKRLTKKGRPVMSVSDVASAKESVLST